MQENWDKMTTNITDSLVRAIFLLLMYIVGIALVFYGIMGFKNRKINMWFMGLFTSYGSGDLTYSGKIAYIGPSFFCVAVGVIIILVAIYISVIVIGQI